MAQYHLFLMYFNGLGVVKDTAMAIHWLQKATTSEDNKIAAEAYLMLGNFYVDGVGVEKNFTNALACYEKSANKGHAAAAYNTGGFYLEGIGTPKDIDKAARYLSISMEGGHGEAPRLLGELYFNGTLGIDLNKAKEYAQIALQRGDIKASAFLQAIKNSQRKENASLNAKYNQGIRFLQSGQLNLAESRFQELVTYPVFSAQSYTNLGIIFGMREEYDLSVDSFQKALQIDSQNVETWGNLGYTYMQIERWQEAVEALKSALKWDPNHQRSQVNLMNAQKKIK